MTMRTVIVLVGAFMITCAPAWAAENQPTAAAEVERLERAWSAAFLEHDVATISSILADDYVGIDGRGVVTSKSDEIDEAKAPAPNAPSVGYRILSEELSAVRVRVFGDAAVLTAINTARISDRGEDTSVRYRRTTVYVRRNGRWQCVSFHGSRITIEPAQGPDASRDTGEPMNADMAAPTQPGSIDEDPRAFRHPGHARISPWNRVAASQR